MWELTLPVWWQTRCSRSWPRITPSLHSSTWQVSSECAPAEASATKHRALISFSVPAEEAGVDLGQKKDSYFYSCCHNNWCAATCVFLGGTWMWTNETHQLWNPTKTQPHWIFIYCFLFRLCHKHGELRTWFKRIFDCAANWEEKYSPVVALSLTNWTTQAVMSSDDSISVRTIGLQPFPLFVYISANSCGAVVAQSTAMCMKPGSDVVMFSLIPWWKSLEKLPWTKWNVLKGLILEVKEAGRNNVSRVCGVAPRWAVSHTQSWILGKKTQSLMGFRTRPSLINADSFFIPLSKLFPTGTTLIASVQCVRTRWQH